MLDLPKIDGRRPIETARFPGWTVRVRYDDIRCELQLTARRKSDNKVLCYSEPCFSERDFWGALRSLTAKLGADFLDLVPAEPR